MTEGDSPVRAATLRIRIKPAGERRSRSRSATRALDILELFGSVRRPLRAIEVSRALETSASSVNQLLKTMVESAHLTFDAVTKSYAPSLRLAPFADWMIAVHGTGQRVHDLMAELELASHESVTLATPEGLFMLILDRVGSTRVETPERGLRVSIFGSALGTAYLSTLSDGEVRRFADRARVAHPHLDDVLARVASARRDGFADGVSADGRSWSLAAPLSSPGSLAPLVIGLAGRTEDVRDRLDELRRLIREVPARHRLDILRGGAG